MHSIMSLLRPNKLSIGGYVYFVSNGSMINGNTFLISYLLSCFRLCEKVRSESSGNLIDGEDDAL